MNKLLILIVFLAASFDSSSEAILSQKEACKGLEQALLGPNNPKHWTCLKIRAKNKAPGAEFYVGYRLTQYSHKHLETNIEEGLYWLNNAAARNEDNAQRWLGSIYYEGIIVPKNLELSYQWGFLMNLNMDYEYDWFKSVKLELSAKKQQSLQSEAYKLMFKKFNPRLTYTRNIRYDFRKKKLTSLNK